MARIERTPPGDEAVAWSIFAQYADKGFSFTDCTGFALVQRLDLGVCLAVDSDLRAHGLHCLLSLA